VPTPEPTNPKTILLAEDEETDAIMFRFAMKSSGLTFPLVVARDGQEVVDYLSGLDPYGDRGKNPLPSLLVLDLKMPRITGFDVLSWLKTRPDLDIPAVVLSSSSYPEDIQKAKKLGAREYFIKPHSLVELSKLLQTVTSRWLVQQESERQTSDLQP
jgi:CheY-like chemotaxis protein